MEINAVHGQGFLDDGSKATAATAKDKIIRTTRAKVVALAKSWGLQRLLFALGVAAAPVSIAVSEGALGISLLFRLALWRRRALFIPRVFWFWFAWAALEVAVWLHSTPLRAGAGEIRHLGLVLAMFVLVPTLDLLKWRIAVWRVVLASATLSSAYLIRFFISRMLSFRGQIDPVIYFRNGGLVHHWMIYGTIEILVFPALLAFLEFYPEDRWWAVPALGVNAVAIVLSLTRMLWICALIVLAIHIAWHRRRWLWVILLIPLVAFLLGPNIVRLRVTESIHPDYYSNSERVQMLKVGWKMICAHPIVGVGPGRVDALYTTYLSASDPVPAYHGHLHNNLVELAAEFGLPVAAAALGFVALLFRDLMAQYKRSINRQERFLCSTGLLALAGFLASGLFDYTYGHSLGLILLSFAVLGPLLPSSTALNDAGAAIPPLDSVAAANSTAGLQI